MSLDQNALNRIMGAARARNVMQVDELWVDLLSMGGVAENHKSIVKVAEEVGRRGDPEKAGEMLAHPLLRSALKEASLNSELFEVLRKAVNYSGRVQGIRDDLLEAYRFKYADREGLEAVISRTDLGGEGRLGEAVRQLDEAFYFQEGDYVFHGRGWGVGRVVETHPASSELVIDFFERKGQRMDAGMALSALEHRTDEDLDVLLWTDPDQLRELAANDPIGLLRKALVTHGGTLQSKTLRNKLTDTLGKSGWTKFWGKARKAAKEDPAIEIGEGARATISLRDEPLSREDEVSERIRKLRLFTDRLQVARRELIAVRKSATDTPPSWLEATLKALSTNHGKVGTPEQRAARLELAMFQGEVSEVWPAVVPDAKAWVEDAEGEVDPETGEKLPVVLDEFYAGPLRGLEGEAICPVIRECITPEYRKRAVRLLMTLDAEIAVATIKAIVFDPSAQTWDAAVRGLSELGRDDEIVDAINTILINPSKHPQALAAFARGRLNGNLDVLPERSDAEILIKVLKVFDAVNLALKGTTIRKEKAILKVSVEALRTTITEKSQKVLKTVIGGASEGDVRRILQIVRQSPTLTNTVKRAAEKAVSHRFPEFLSTVATTHRAEEEDVDDTIYSTADGVQRHEAELHEILSVKMEDVRLEIGRALEFGDISENAELDAAREKQQRLAEQASRMQEELTRVALVDPSKVKTDVIRIGTRIVVSGEEGEETYTILGPWDTGDHDPSIISHFAAVARGLMGCAVGDEAKINLPNNKTATYTVKAIEQATVTSR
ncbi:MAG: GreA/GreB family elongation factor [Planctomycetes bacterium]|nr:GreA/GreB family elongation factor [Planctomycetota bacterium]